MGGEQALDVQQQAQASMICQAKLDGVKVGSESISGGSNGTVDMGAVTWNYTIDSNPGDVGEPYIVKITVKLDPA